MKKLLLSLLDHPADEGRLEKQLDTEIEIKGEEEAAVKAENKVELEKQEAESPQSQRGTPDTAGSPQNKAEGLYFLGSVFLLCPPPPPEENFLMLSYLFTLCTIGKG
jgi:hypothetical protein